MFVPKKLLPIAIVVMVMLGCAQTPNLDYYKKEFENNPPSTKWLEENVDNFRDKAWLDPTKDNVETFAFVKGMLDERKAIEKMQREWQEETHMLLTVDWIKASRGGAAFRQSGYEHVLAKRRPILTVRTYRQVASADGVSDMVVSSLDKLVISDRMLAWQRYCNAGEGMTAKDWEIVIADGVFNVPPSLADKCIPPK